MIRVHDCPSVSLVTPSLIVATFGASSAYRRNMKNSADRPSHHPSIIAS